MKKVAIILLFLTFSWNSFSAHLIGGELSYECLNEADGTYRVLLQIYRDCNCTECAEMDDPAYITIFDAFNSYVGVIEMPLDLNNEIEQVIPNTDNLCTDDIPDVCVERSTGYDEIVTIPPAPGGYKLVYQRCCRNNTITNIIDPGSTGSTYEVQIPGTDLVSCNNSPTFNNFPPIIICAGYPLIFDHSASDADGDSLVYELCTPYEGATPQDPYPTQASNPPYNNISWIGTYNENNQIGGIPEMTIDPETGLLNGFPDQIGQFVVGICVKEFRDGVLLSTSVRDFQFNITDCDLTQAAVLSDDITPSGEFILNECGAYNVTFINQSLGADTYYWNFGDLTTSNDFSNLENPSYLYPDTGVYDITLVANPNTNCTDTAFIELSLYPLLEPDFNFVSGCSAEQVEFIDNSNSQYGIISEWLWDFGDGSDTDSNQNPVHLYGDGGLYEVSLLITNTLGCSESIEQDVSVNPSPIPVGGNSALCLDAQPIQFTDLSTVSSGNIVSWLWNFGDNTTSQLEDPTHTYTSSGDYSISLEVISDEGCENTFLTDITIYDEIIADAGGNITICLGESVDVLAMANVPATFEWNPITGINGPNDEALVTFAPLQNSNYTLQATDPNGCVDIDQIDINVIAPPIVNAGSDSNLCLGESMQLNASATDGNGNPDNVSYSWSPNTFISNPNISDPTIDPEENITYFLTITDLNNGCTAMDSVEIFVFQPIEPIVTGDTTVCQNSSVQLSAAGGDTFSWSPVTGLDDPNISNPVATPESTQQYTVDISNVCFSVSVDVFVEVLSLPQVDAGTGTELNIGETFQLQGSSENSNTFFWSPMAGLSDSTSASPIAQPLNSTNYILTVRGSNGCTNSDSVYIKVTKFFDIWIGNAFSPNQDAVNDEIGMLTRGIKELESFKIYNRWGQLLWEGSDLSSKWDGNFNDIPQEVGVYIYYIVGITFEDNPFPVKGNITLLR